MNSFTDKWQKYGYHFFDTNILKRKNDTNSLLFKKIMKYEISDCNIYFDEQDFEDELYLISSFEREESLLQKYLQEDDYIFIHSYGKNGKSTFINRYVNKYDLYCIIIDFSDDKNTSLAKMIRSKLLNQFRLVLRKYKRNPYTLHPFIQFCNYIISNFDTNKSSNLTKFSSKLYDNSEQIIKNLSYRTNQEGLFNFELFIDEINISLSEDNELFNLLIAFLLFNSIKIDKKENVYFIFDNLDDVFTYLPEQIRSHYVANTIHFLEDLRKYWPNIFAKDEISYTVVPKFIFLYRTSNFLSTVIHLNLQSDSNNSRSSILNTSSIAQLTLSSVKSSKSIIEKRCSFYKNLCEKHKIKTSPKFDLLEYLLPIFNEENDSKSKFKPTTFFRFWNGNKIKFIEFLLEIDISKKDILILTNNKLPNKLRIEVLYHYLITYFKSSKYGNKNTPFSGFIDHVFQAFNNNLNEERCDLSRLFFTYVFNVRYNNYNELTARNIHQNGVSLNEFVHEIKKILKPDKSALFSDEDLLTMFNNLFSCEIDNWGNFFSCCSDSIRTTEEENRSQYKWVKSVKHCISNHKVSEEDVILYPHDSAPYFMFQIRRSFEYFAISSSKERILSESFISSINYSELENATRNIYFVQILNNVLERVKTVTSITMNSFINNFNYNTEDYCKSNWAYNEKMYFDDLISKLISYLEDIRYFICNGEIMIGGDFPTYSSEKQYNIKIEINKIFLNYIGKFIGIFEQLYESCSMHSIGISQSLNETNFAFQELKSKLQNAKLYPHDFSIKLRTGI